MSYDICKVFGENVKKQRKNKGLSQEKFVELIEIGVTSLSLIERGKGFATANTIEKISSVLGMSVSDLMNDVEIEDANTLYFDILKRLENIKTNRHQLKLVSEYLKLLTGMII